MNKTKLFTIIGSVVLTVAIGVISVFADWNNPAGAPPSNNASTPINVGADPQTKAGTLTAKLGKLDVADFFGAVIRAADLQLGHSSRRGEPGRALVDLTNTLSINHDSDWATTKIGGTKTTIDGELVANKICLGGVCKEAWPDSGTPTAPGSSYTPGEWFNNKLSFRHEDNENWGWGSKKSDSFVAGHDINRIRLRGSTNDGGYCYAYWRKDGVGLGHAETVRHSGNEGYYTLSNEYYPTFANPTSRLLGYADTCLAYGNEGQCIEYDCSAYPGTTSREGGCFTPLTCAAPAQLVEGTDELGETTYQCVTYCPGNSFDSDGNVKLCQINWSAGPLTTVDRAVTLPEGSTVYLEGRHTRGVAGDFVDCALDIQYAP